MSDIRATLEAVRKRLNEFMHAAEPRQEDWVVLSNLVDAEGKPVERAQNRLVMFLAGIQKESMVSTYTAAVPAGNTSFSIVAPPLYVDLYVLLMANFQDAGYSEGLRVISLGISFFQQNPSFTPDTLPDLPEEVDRLTWDMTNLDAPGMHFLMGLAGTKYLPSVYYRVRLLPFQTGAVQRQEPAVEGMQTPGEPKDVAPGPGPLFGTRASRAQFAGRKKEEER
jgi:hypothetical protein